MKTVHWVGNEAVLASERAAHENIQAVREKKQIRSKHAVFRPVKPSRHFRKITRRHF